MSETDCHALSIPRLSIDSYSGQPWLSICSGELPPDMQHSGDWGCLQPGPTNCAPVEYSHFFYCRALALQSECATRLGEYTCNVLH